MDFYDVIISYNKEKLTKEKLDNIKNKYKNLKFSIVETPVGFRLRITGVMNEKCLNKIKEEVQ